MSQSNTQLGDLKFAANEDLTGKEGYLVKLVDDTNVPKLALPTANDDRTPYVVINGDEADKQVDVRPLTSERNFRVKATGTAVAGDAVVLADTAGADKGKVRKLPTDAGTYRVIGVFEETVADGQLALFRPTASDVVTVT